MMLYFEFYNNYSTQIFTNILIQFNKYTELQYHGTENFVTVSKNDIAVLLNFGILQSPIRRLTEMPL